MHMSPQQDWINELVQIARKLVRTLDRRRVPRNLFQGTITRSHYIAWGKQTLLYVKETSPNLRTSGRRLMQWGREHARIARLLLTKTEEEQGHDRWMFSDLLNLGCSRAELESAAPYPSVQVYIATHRLQAEEGSPYFILGTAVVLEFVSEHRASMAAENLVARSEIPGIANSISFITLHGQLDGGHVDDALELLRGITCPKAQAAILAGARHTASVLPGFFPKPLGGLERKVA
jgi:pyrroloquinoline quinone (PQQ) biosynthesis protein C